MALPAPLWFCPRCGRKTELFVGCSECDPGPLPEDPIGRAAKASARGRSSLAIRVLEARRDDGDTAARRKAASLLGATLTAVGRHAEASAALTEAWEASDGTDTNARLELATSLFRAGRTTQARALLGREGDPLEASVLLARVALAETTSLEENLAVVQALAEQHPDAVELSDLAAEAWERAAQRLEGDEAKASASAKQRAAAERAWTSGPKTVARALRFARAFSPVAEEAARVREALEAVKEAGSREPEWHAAWVRGLLKSGEATLAQEAAKEAQARFPEETALVRLAQEAAKEAWARKRAELLAGKKNDGATTSAPPKTTGDSASTTTTRVVNEGPKASGEAPRFLNDLRQQLRKGVFPPTRPMPEREREVLEALCRSQRANAMVTGRTGCGKSSLLRAVAQRLAEDEGLPELLRGLSLYELDSTVMVGGTDTVGTLEERITELTRFCESNKLVVFIDNAHLLQGAGSYKGRPAGLSELLQPLMSNGSAKLVLATGDEQFEDLSRSGAFERRVTRVRLPSMEASDAESLLTWLQPRLEAHYQLVIPEEVVGLATRLAEHHVQTRALPDSAIDLLERSCTKALFDDVTQVGRDHVVRALAQLLRLPLEQVQLDRMSALLQLEELLVQRVIGQEEAVRRVAEVVRMTKAGLDLNPYRPDGVFLFVGPSGVGKTELARGLAELLNRDPTGFVRLDMSEFMETHTVSRLFGTTPGYVGFEQQGQLTGALRVNPGAVVLLDEIEKAHPSVYDVFLQVFDAGRVTDGHGQLVDCSRATFIMTSNLGTAELSASKVGFARETSRQDRERTVRSALERHFRPEFLNRLDAVVVFDALGEDTMRRIVSQKLSLLSQRFATRNVTLELDGTLVDFLAQKVDLLRTGARGLMRAIEHHLAMPLTREVLAHPGCRAFRVTLTDGVVAIHQS